MVDDDESLQILIDYWWNWYLVYGVSILESFGEITDDEIENLELIILSLCQKINEQEIIDNNLSKSEYESLRQPHFNDLLLMQSNEVVFLRYLIKEAGNDYTTPPTEIIKHIRLYYFIRKILSLDTFPENTAISPTLFKQIFYREMANSFGYWEGDEMVGNCDMFGYGIYPAACFFNHSCNPNVSKFHEGKEMIFFSSRKIEIGEECFIAYGDIDAPVEERRSRLLKHYFFECNCDKCLLELKELEEA